MRPAVFALALTMATPLAAETEPDAFPSNAEMAEMYAADQSERQGEIDWMAVSRNDAERRRRTRVLLDAGALTTADDFYAAAFIFQHGGQPENYLLAHALAVRAVALQHPRAEWIAAATLDRYLHSIARDQIYGTQFSMSPLESASQGRYDRELLPDALRTAIGVETLAEQDEKLEAMERRRLERWPEANE